MSKLKPNGPCVCILEALVFNRPKPLRCWQCGTAQRYWAAMRLAVGTQMSLPMEKA
jgi:hypothetical protein